MSSSRPRLIDPLLRKALWEAHKHRCSYDGQEIATLDKMQVDHILPQWLWKPDANIDLAPILSALELRSDYHPDSLDNLLPVRELRNKQKGSWLFDEADARFFRKIAKEKSVEVEHLCRKFEDEKEQERIRSEAEAACSANPTLKEKLLAALAATEPFKIENYVSSNQVRFARSRVRIDCYLPDERGFGSLLIHINTLYLHRVLITLESRQIIDSLFHGWGTLPELRQRRFVIGPRIDQPDEWIVNICGTTVFLTTEELRQFCEVLDLLAPIFLNSVLTRETAAGTLSFAPDGRNNVRLLCIQRVLWALLLEFARDHDYAKGNSPWHIFDASGHGHIKIVRRTENGEIIPFDAYIYPASSESVDWSDMTRPNDEVCLCWEWSLSRLGPGAPADAPVGWTAEATHQWLAEKLIPTVVRRLPQEKSSMFNRFIRWASNHQPQCYFSETEGVDPAIFLPTNDWPELLHFAELVQIFYNCHPHDPVHRRVIESAQAGLSLLAGALSIDSAHLGYYADKLGVSRAGNLLQLVAASQRQHAAMPSFDGFVLDNILRCVWSLLRDHAPAPGKQYQLLGRVNAAFSPLIVSFRYDVIRDRAIRRLDNRSVRDA